jgi:arylsulfatase A
MNFEDTQHSPWLTEATLRIPLIVRLPGSLAAGVEDAPVSLVDVFPTVLDGLELEVPATVAGTSLLAPQLPARVTFSETFYERYPMRADEGEELVVLREGRFKLYLRPGRRELHDLELDPGEQTDVASQHPEVVSRLLDSWREMASGWPAERRSTLLELSEDELREHEAALRSLGYIE